MSGGITNHCIAELHPDGDPVSAYFLLQSIYSTVINALVDCDEDSLLTQEFIGALQASATSEYALLSALLTVDAAPQLLLDAKHFFTHTWLGRLKAVECVGFDEQHPCAILNDAVL